MKRWLPIVLPIAILGAGLVGAVAMIAAREEVATAPAPAPVPVVRVVTAEPETVTLRVHSEGTVTPRRTTTLVSEVTARVVFTSDALVAGGFFDEGDLLLRVDPTDYRLALEQARSKVAQAELRVAQEEAAARVARREWSEMGSEERESPLATHELQLAEARASLAAARAALEQARRDLERTEVRAPFAGRVLEKQAELGQFLTRGAPIATIYAIDVAEVRLPIPDHELAYVDLPLAGAQGPGAPHPRVRLSAQFAGIRHIWTGRIVRTEGQIDPRTRMLYAVAEVLDPFRSGSNDGAPPLAPGMFVEAEIEGHTVKDVFRLPRAALREGGVVYVVDDAGALRFRQVEILRVEPDRVLIASGLSSGEKVCISLLDAVSEGMRVRIHEEDLPQAAAVS